MNEERLCGGFIEQVKIKTRRRWDDWIAYVEDSPAIWEAGQTEQEAIDKLHITLKSGLDRLSKEEERTRGRNDL